MDSSSEHEEVPETVQPSASDPITFTDPDGSVTRVAAWSSWTREQIRAPGGEPLLVTRIDQGQLWFAAGRRRSPWRHDVIAGSASVTTLHGRFHVTAEADGGATIACLAGRTRVHARLSEPVIVGPNQVASVSADGTTVIVTDSLSTSPGERSSASATLAAAAADEPDYLSTDLGDDLSDESIGDPTPMPAVTSPMASMDESGSDEGEFSSGSVDDDSDDDDDGTHDAADPDPDRGVEMEDDQWPAVAQASPVDADGGRETRAVPWLPEMVAVAAMLGVLIAAAIFFGRGSDSSAEVAVAPTSVVTTLVVTTSGTPTTTAAPATTAAPITTAPLTTPPALTAPATATGQLTGCRRAAGGVQATVTVSHQSGGAGSFAVQVGLVDATGVFAEAVGQSAEVPPGGSIPVDVLVPVSGPAGGSCELLGVSAA